MANEKRLIYAEDALAAEFTIEADGAIGYVVDSEVIRRLPTVDAVEVVRCKHCAKDGLTTCPLCWIENHTLNFVNHDPNFYCGAAERKTDND